MRVGTMFLGRVEGLENESIQTKFFVLGVPLVPMESFYVLEEHGSGVRGVLLPSVHAASALAGYLRIGSGIAALLAGVFAYVERSPYRDAPVGLYALTAVSLLVWGLSMFVLGRLSPAERERRSRLRLLTGLGAPPSLLPIDVRDSAAGRLRLAWERAHPGEDWRDVLEKGAVRPDDALLVWGLAEYDGSDALIEMAGRALAR